MNDDIGRLISGALRKRAENGGRHLHHRDCIHNLPPLEQVMARGKTVEWWLAWVGSLPEQIAPDQWETTTPFAQEHRAQEPLGVEEQANE